MTHYTVAELTHAQLLLEHAAARINSPSPTEDVRDAQELLWRLIVLLDHETLAMLREGQ